jgi:hypothetical protein
MRAVSISTVLPHVLETKSSILRKLLKVTILMRLPICSRLIGRLSYYREVFAPVFRFH